MRRSLNFKDKLRYGIMCDTVSKRLMVKVDYNHFELYFNSLLNNDHYSLNCKYLGKDYRIM